MFLVLWSLSVEEQFYLLWAPVVRWASRRTLFLVTCGALAFSPVLRYFIHDAVGTEYKFVPARLDGLACGALLALLISHEGYRRKLYWVFHNVWLCPAILIGSFVAVGWTKDREFGSHWFSVIGYSLISVAFLFLVAYSLEQTGTNSVLCRLLRSEPWQNIGKVSYVFYLIHLPIRVYLNSFLLLHLGKGYAQKTLTLAGSFGLTWVLANLSWRYFESPILR